MTDIAHLREWVGRSTVEHGVAANTPLAALAALLDHATPPWPVGEVPPLGHWLYFPPTARQSELGEDGHPRRGDLLPPVPLPRRMWAGGGIRFLAPLPVGAPIRRRSKVIDIIHKAGQSGELVFVTVSHEIVGADDTLLVEERQDIVYRDNATATPRPPPPAPPPPSLVSRAVPIDPVMLFRYSALTFNAHRIHYDRDFARDREGYPGLVVHGPLQATLLVDLFMRQATGRRIVSFDFRSRRPVFDGAALALHLGRVADTTELWTAGPDGQPAMTATIRTT